MNKNYKKVLLYSALFVIVLHCTPGYANHADMQQPLKEFQEACRYIASKQQQLSEHIIIVNTKNQQLSLFTHKGELVEQFRVSTGKRGIGQTSGSFKTPLGLHMISHKIGEGVPLYGIFKYRQYTKAIWKKPRIHIKDYIVTRILCLQGLEPQFNQGSKAGVVVDSFQRTIYIHGTTLEHKLGSPATKGCVHLSSHDIVRLFNLVNTGTLVLIV